MKLTRTCLKIVLLLDVVRPSGKEHVVDICLS